MSYSAYVTVLKNVRPHPNADRMKLADCFGNTVCVSLDAYENQLGVYFPVDGQVSVEFAEHNNLLRKRDENGKEIGGYMDPNKRNITAIKLRGEKSDGLFLPLSCLDYCFKDSAATHLKAGDTIDVVNGHDICTKYIPQSNKQTGRSTDGNKTRQKRAPIAPLFAEHADTAQLAYNLGDFREGDQIEITLKLHGTSQRTGYLPVLSGFHRTIWDKLFRRPGSPIYSWDLVTGTRRTVLEGDVSGGYYGSNAFRIPHAELFRGKLWKGETVYYEVVGFTDSGTPIMGACSNKKLNDKEFVKQYGETTTFSYGCDYNGGQVVSSQGIIDIINTKPQSDIYVYRMTMTNEDGNVVEYTPDFMRYRCEQMGVKTVPVFWKGTIHEDPIVNISPGEWIKNIAERFYDGPDPIGKSHIREGVVVRILNRPKFCAYKHKNHNFKMLSGIIVEVVADGEATVDDTVIEEL